MARGICLLLLALAAQVQASSLPDTIESIRGAVVAIGSYQGTRRPPAVFRGTGFVVDDGRTIVTNYHVLPEKLNHDRREFVAAFSGEGRKVLTHRTRILAEDPLHDLAVLGIDGKPLPTFELAPANGIREGEEIAFTGFPIGMVLGIHPVTHRGIVAAITPIVIPQTSSNKLTVKLIRAMRDPYKVLQLDAVAYPGNSGSAVYDQRTGRVVGVINSVLVKGTKESVLSAPSGITYAIPVEYVHKLLRDAKAKRAQR